ncbi:MAG TPA: hypothetical protein VIN38_14815, partial [Thiobacillus sp.]
LKEKRRGREYAFAGVKSGHSTVFIANGRCAVHSRPQWRRTPTAAMADERASPASNRMADTRVDRPLNSAGVAFHDRLFVLKMPNTKLARCQPVVFTGQAQNQYCRSSHIYFLYRLLKAID